MKLCAYCKSECYDITKKCESCGSTEFISPEELIDETDESDEPEVPDKRYHKLIMFMLVPVGIILFILLAATAFEVLRFNSQF